MIIIGLTGSIASGKSSILNFIKKQNIPTHDSDAVVARLYNNPPKEFIYYLKSIGLTKFIKQKKIDKKKVRNKVLKNKEKLRKLERFIHKKVKLSRDKFIIKNRRFRKKIIVIDIPLLFENNLETICDYVFLAYCPSFKLRVTRALKRNNMNKNILTKFIKLQMPDKLKIIKSDFVINTSLTKNLTNAQTLRAIKTIKKTKY